MWIHCGISSVFFIFLWQCSSKLMRHMNQPELNACRNTEWVLQGLEFSCKPFSLSVSFTPLPPASGTLLTPPCSCSSSTSGHSPRCLSLVICLHRLLILHRDIFLLCRINDLLGGYNLSTRSPPNLSPPGRILRVQIFQGPVRCSDLCVPLSQPAYNWTIVLIICGSCPLCFVSPAFPLALKLTGGSSLSFSHSTQQAPSSVKCVLPFNHGSTFPAVTVPLWGHHSAYPGPSQLLASACHRTAPPTARWLHKHSPVHFAALWRSVQWHPVASYTASKSPSPASKASHAAGSAPPHPCCSTVIRPVLSLELSRENLKIRVTNVQALFQKVCKYFQEGDGPGHHYIFFKNFPGEGIKKDTLVVTK